MAEITYSHMYVASVDVVGAPTTAERVSNDVSGGSDNVVVFTTGTPPGGAIELNGEATWGFYIGRVDGPSTGANELSILVRDNGGTYYILTDDAGIVASTSYSVNAAAPLVVCLLNGTKIETIRGIVNVEDLIPGDLVLNSQGSYSPVRWVGVQTLSPLFSGKASWPVKISKDALGQNTPDRDLYVSQDHAIFLQGLLICANALVNGTTITIEKPTDSSIRYFGLDLGPATIHPVSNLLVGSLGAVPREYFDNYQEWLDSGHELIDEPLMFPRVKSASQLPEQVKRGISA